MALGDTGTRIVIERLGDVQPLHREVDSAGKRGSTITLRVKDPINGSPRDGRVGEPLVELYWSESPRSATSDTHKVFGAQIHHGCAFSDAGLAAFVGDVAKRAKRSGATTIFIECDDDVPTALRLEKVDISVSGFPPLSARMLMERSIEVVSHLDAPVIGVPLSGDNALTPSELAAERAELAAELTSYRQQSSELRTELAAAGELIERVRLSDSVVTRAAEDGVVLPSLAEVGEVDQVLTLGWKPILRSLHANDRLLPLAVNGYAPESDSAIQDGRWKWAYDLGYVEINTGRAQPALLFTVVRDESSPGGRSVDVTVIDVDNITQAGLVAFSREVPRVAALAEAKSLTITTADAGLFDVLASTREFRVLGSTQGSTCFELVQRRR